MSFDIPVVFGVLPYELTLRQYHFEFWLIGAAAAIGVLSAPAYLYVLFGGGMETSARALKRNVVRASLLSGAVAAVAAFIFTILAFWPLTIFPGLTLAMCLHLWIRYERLREVHEAEAGA